MTASVLAPALLSTQASCSGTHAARMLLVIRSTLHPRSNKVKACPYSGRGVPSEGAWPSPVCSLADWRTLASAVRGHAQGLTSHGGTRALRLTSPDAYGKATCDAFAQPDAMAQIEGMPLMAKVSDRADVEAHPPARRACRLTSSTRLLLNGKTEGAQRGLHVVCALLAQARQLGADNGGVLL